MQKSDKLLLSSLSLTAFAFVGEIANSLDFNDKVYGRGEFHLGYSVGLYSGDAKKTIQQEVGDKVIDEAVGYKNKVGQIINADVGFNVYYKLKDNIHPFAGLSVDGRYNFKGEFIKDSNFQNFLNVNAKLGASFKVNKNIAIRPYALVGMSVNMYTHNKEEKDMKRHDVNADGRLDNYDVAIQANLMHIMSARDPLHDNALNSYDGRKYTFYTSSDYGVNLLNAADSTRLLVNRIIKIETTSGEDFIARLPGDCVIHEGRNLFFFDNDRTNTRTYFYIHTNDLPTQAALETIIEEINRDGTVANAIARQMSELYESIMNDNRKNNIGLNVGGGIDVEITNSWFLKDYLKTFTVGVEYRYNDVKIYSAKFQTHNVGVKFGVEVW